MQTPLELDQAIQLAVIHQMPALVVHPNLLGHAMMLRVRRQGKFKIMMPVDWPKGEIYGMLKLRGMTNEAMQSDGYEIMLTGGRTEAETRNEAKALMDFIRNHISVNAEIRFVLGVNSRAQDNVLTMCRIMKDLPTPALLRTDHHLKMQVTKANTKTHSAILEAIRTETGVPVKIGGNIDCVRTLAGCVTAGAARFAVSYQQAQAIIIEIRKQPDGLRELLDGTRPETIPKVMPGAIPGATT